MQGWVNAHRAMGALGLGSMALYCGFGCAGDTQPGSALTNDGSAGGSGAPGTSGSGSAGGSAGASGALVGAGGHSASGGAATSATGGALPETAGGTATEDASAAGGARSALDGGSSPASDGSVDGTKIDAGVQTKPPLDYVECQVHVVPQDPPPCPLDCGPNGYCRLNEEEAPYCRCQPGSVGARCEGCDVGYERQFNGACRSWCSLANVECAGGRCGGSRLAPTCECNIPYEGEACNTCADGFESGGILVGIGDCVPTCGGTCTRTEECVLVEEAVDGEQACQCLPGYGRSGSGPCAWQGLLADPDFAAGCAAWQLWTEAPNVGNTAEADIRDGELSLAVSHVCGLAMAVSDAYMPIAEEAVGKALRFEARGSVGSILHVAFSAAGVGPSATPTSDASFVGTGQWESHRVCFSLGLFGGVVGNAVNFFLGEDGWCATRIDHAFRVRSLSVVEDASCDPPEN